MPDESVSLATIGAEVTHLSPLLSMDDVLLTHSRMQWLKGEVKRFNDLLEEHMVEWIRENGRDIVDGDKRWYIGKTKKVKPKDLPAAVQAVLEATGGDFNKFCEMLSSGALKYGACGKLLGDRFDEYFDTSYEDGIEEGKPKLKVFNEAFKR